MCDDDVVCETKSYFVIGLVVFILSVLFISMTAEFGVPELARKGIGIPLAIISGAVMLFNGVVWLYAELAALEYKP